MRKVYCYDPRISLNENYFRVKDFYKKGAISKKVWPASFEPPA